MMGVIVRISSGLPPTSNIPAKVERLRFCAVAGLRDRSPGVRQHAGLIRLIPAQGAGVPDREPDGALRGLRPDADAADFGLQTPVFRDPEVYIEAMPVGHVSRDMQPEAQAGPLTTSTTCMISHDTTK